MEVGTEISQKIRSAIKAKLMELGAYVDDELPDYIMVMVANKKNKSQMKADLSLFLGSNTDTFTSWLHSLLGKLQTITVESSKNKADDDKLKGTKPKEKKKGKTKGSSGKTKDDLMKSKKGGKEKNRKRKSSHGSGEDAPKSKVSASNTLAENKINEDNHNAEQPESNPELTAVENVVQEPSEPSLDAERQAVQSKQIAETEPCGSDQIPSIEETPVQEEFEDVRQLLVASTPGDELAQELDAVEEEAANLRTKTMKERLKPPADSGSSKVLQNKPLTSSGSPPCQQTIKRRVPSSVVASVGRYQDEDEEYDPFNPAVGSVASVVKVTSRKSTFPPSMQANRQSSVEDTPDANDTDQIASTNNEKAQNLLEPGQKRMIGSSMVDLECVKGALTEVLEKFQYNQAVDEIGHFARSVEWSLRSLDRKAYVEARTKIQNLLDYFKLEGSSTKLELLPSTRSRTSNGKLEQSKDSTCIVGGGKHMNEQNENKLDKESGSPERIIFSSKSKKSPVLTSSEKGSEFYRTFVSSILNPTPGATGSEHCLTDGNNVRATASASASASHGQLHPSVQPLVSSTKMESDPLRAVSSFNNEGLKVSTSSPKPTISSSSSSTLSPSVTLLQSATITKSPASDPGFHRLRSQILVDSLHIRRRPDPASSSSPSTCLLRHAWSKQRGGDKEDGEAILGESSTGSPSSHSPQHYSGEALKVLAKNLRVTIVNRQAKGAEESSSGEDSSSDDDSDEEDSSAENDEEDSNEINENQAAMTT